jgi:hypothetical protein
MMTIRRRHAYAVAIFLAFVAAAPAASARPGVPRRTAQPPAQAAAALPAEPAAQAAPVPRHRDVAAAAPERTDVPAEAFLQPADTGDVEHAFQRWTGHTLPALCDARFASNAAIAVGGHILALYHPRRAEGYIPGDVFHQTIAVYRPGGAARFMAELRRAVNACPVDRVSRCHSYRDDAGYRLLRAPDHGDAALLGRTTFPQMSNDGPTGRTATEWFLAVRVGDAVMVLANTGYEFGHLDYDAFREVGARAAQRFTAWARR